MVDEAVKRGGADDKTCTVIYFKWRKDLFAPKVVTEPAESAEPAQHKRQSGGLQQEEQQGAASPSSRASDGEEAGERVQAAKTDCEAALQEKSKATAADSSSDSEQEKEPHAAASPADSREHEECPGRKEAVAIPEGAREVKEAGPSGSAEAARDEGSRPVRSSGLEEIAGITSSLDVETLIRKRKREQQLEEEAAAAAAAEAADVSLSADWQSRAISSTPVRVEGRLLQVLCLLLVRMTLISSARLLPPTPRLQAVPRTTMRATDVETRVVRVVHTSFRFSVFCGNRHVVEDSWEWGMDVRSCRENQRSFSFSSDTSGMVLPSIAAASAA